MNANANTDYPMFSDLKRIKIMFWCRSHKTPGEYLVHQAPYRFEISSAENNHTTANCVEILPFFVYAFRCSIFVLSPSSIDVVALYGIFALLCIRQIIWWRIKSRENSICWNFSKPIYVIQMHCIACVTVCCHLLSYIEIQLEQNAFTASTNRSQ